MRHQLCDRMGLVWIEIIGGFILHQDIADLLTLGGIGVNELNVRATFRCAAERIDNFKLILQVGEFVFGKPFLQTRVKRLDVIWNVSRLQAGKLFDAHLCELQGKR